MCGIAGILNTDREHPVEGATLERMLSIMRHRGPDGDGVHLDGPVGLGHLRLSIIDLGAGAQPLSNEDGTVWITFNGEIYNYLELREKLLARGHRFRTHSDTEVIVHLYEDYGPDCVHQLRGMFAFSIWDARQRQLFVARDRVGIKPLYYFSTSSTFAFASEIKSLLTLPAAPRQLSDEAVDAFWCFNYLPGELTMFQGIRKLLPGHWLKIDASGAVTTRQYWDLKFAPRSDFRSLGHAADELSTLLRETIRLHMIADVPVGFLLSGGMDSSAVLSYAAAETEKEISTFTIGFDAPGIVDERPYARLMAKQCGAAHYEATFTAGEFWDYLPQLFWHLDEPVCEPPAVALHYISKLARQHVKVLLSGEGGDEAFGGYSNYPNQLLLDRVRSLAGPLKSLAGRGAVALGRLTANHRLQEYGRLLPLRLSDYYWSRVGSPFARDGEVPSPRYCSGFAARLGGHSQHSFVAGLFDRVSEAGLLDQMLYLDTKTWLPDDLLVKADKVTMGNSLELRVPLLDHRVLEFAAALPSSFKVRGRDTKRILKAAFASVLPAEIIHRKKVGFPVPYGHWLAGELWESTRDCLTARDSFACRYFDAASVSELLDRHRTTGAFQRPLFSLLALELWNQTYCQKLST